MSDKFLNQDRTAELWSKVKEYVNEHGGSAGQTFLVNAPIGAIIVWSGTADSVPQGWSICNGENGTLDLRDKFVLGAGTGHEVGKTGGSEEVTLTVDEMPSHSHIFRIDSTSGSQEVSVRSATLGSANITFLNLQAGISNNPVGLSGSSNPHPNMPPYYTALYIQKTGVTPSDYVTTEEMETAIEDALENAGTNFTTDDTLTLQDGVLSVETPVRDLTQEEYDALSEEQKSNGLIFLPDDSTDYDDSGSGNNDGGAVYIFGHGLKQVGMTVSVDAVDNFEGDNTLPMTAAGVQATVGNIEALLSTI